MYMCVCERERGAEDGNYALVWMRIYSIYRPAAS
jgi:hypothetical protein